MKRTLTFLAILLSIQFGYGQYFQQDVAYNIQVKLDDVSNTLRGEEEIVYTNNSPDDLEFIYFHLWPNAYKNKKTALAKQLVRMGETDLYFAEEDDLGYIDSLDFKVNGETIDWKLDSVDIDICKLFLNEPLKSGDQITITTPFKVKIPSGEISRLGHVGQSFQITQWYPKPAVYDTAGWHEMPYLTQGEFYSEFGSFDVYITLPQNYVVGATGDLQTKSEVEWLETKVADTKKWIKEREGNLDWSERSKEMDFPESDSTLKTLHFHQDKVHDFGWFADKRYHVLKGDVKLPGNGESVDVWTMFTNGQAHLWKNSIEYMKDAIYYYSLWNGDYPYKHATAVDGTISAGGGMEYPNVTVIGRAQSSLLLETVIMHEVGHNWFYGILGSNERDYPWMDEGLNSYNEQRYLSTKYPNGTMLSKDQGTILTSFVGFDKYKLKDQHYFTQLVMARTNRDQPMNLKSHDYSTLNYGLVVYSKSAVTLNYLRSYLGDEAMDKAMHKYFDENKFKHPYPKSFEKAVEESTEENLDWFFKDILTTRGRIDYGISKVKEVEGQTVIKLKNRGLKTPVHISLLDQNGDVVREEWMDGFANDTSLTWDAVGHRVEIDHNQIIPEIVRDNNYSRTKGLFKRAEPIKFKLGGSVEQPWINQINFAPAFGANVPNGFMPGIALYNHTIPARKFSYFFLPMFATKGNKVVGSGLLSYSIQPEESAMENIELTLSGKRYIYDRVGGEILHYSRLYPHITVFFRPRYYNGLVREKVSIGSVLTFTDTYKAGKGNNGVVNTMDYFNRASYEFVYGHPVFNTLLRGSLEQNWRFVRTSVEAVETMTIEKKLRLRFRFFAGAMTTNKWSSPVYNWRMDGQSARLDYAYDGEFFDRSLSDDFLGRQFMENHGGFKVPTGLGQSSQWLVAFNFKAKIGKTPIGLFTDIGSSAGQAFMYDAGIYLALLPEVLEVYFPLVYSKNIQKSVEANGLDWVDLIRFQIGLEKLNLFENVKRLNIP